MDLIIVYLCVVVTALIITVKSIFHQLKSNDTKSTDELQI